MNVDGWEWDALSLGPTALQHRRGSARAHVDLLHALTLALTAASQTAGISESKDAYSRAGKDAHTEGIVQCQMTQPA